MTTASYSGTSISLSTSGISLDRIYISSMQYLSTVTRALSSQYAHGRTAQHAQLIHQSDRDDDQLQRPSRWAAAEVSRGSSALSLKRRSRGPKFSRRKGEGETPGIPGGSSLCESLDAHSMAATWYEHVLMHMLL